MLVFAMMEKDHGIIRILRLEGEIVVWVWLSGCICCRGRCGLVQGEHQWRTDKIFEHDELRGAAWHWVHHWRLLLVCGCAIEQGCVSCGNILLFFRAASCTAWHAGVSSNLYHIFLKCEIMRPSHRVLTAFRRRCSVICILINSTGISGNPCYLLIRISFHMIILILPVDVVIVGNFAHLTWEILLRNQHTGLTA